MAGRGAIDSLSLPNNPRILMLTEENEWVVAKDPLHFDKPKIAGVGPGLAFAQEMMRSEKDKKVHCPKCKSHNIKKAFSVFGTSVARGDSSSCPSAPSCGGTGFG